MVAGGAHAAPVAAGHARHRTIVDVEAGKKEREKKLDNVPILQGDPSGWLKPPVDLVPTLLVAGGLLHCSYLLPRRDG